MASKVVSSGGKGSGSGGKGSGGGGGGGGESSALYKAQKIFEILLNGEQLPLQATRVQCYEGDPRSIQIKHTAKNLVTGVDTLGTMVFEQDQVSDFKWDQNKDKPIIRMSFTIDSAPTNSWPRQDQNYDSETLNTLRKIAAAPTGSKIRIETSMFKGVEEFLAGFMAGRTTERHYNRMAWAFEGFKDWGRFWRGATSKFLQFQSGQLEKATEKGAKITWSLLGEGKDKWAWLGHVELSKNGPTSVNLYAGQEFQISLATKTTDGQDIKGDWDVVVRGEGFDEYDHIRFDVRAVTDKANPEFLLAPNGTIYKFIPKENEKYSERIYRGIKDLEAMADPSKASESPIDFSPIVGRTLPPPAPTATIKSFNPKQQAVLETLNPFQRAAAIYSLSVQGGIAYIQGPPGTGKSHTIQRIAEVELLNGPKRQVIICGPSNASVDSVFHHFVKAGMGKRYNLLRVRSTATEADTALPNYSFSLYKKMLDKDSDGQFKALSEKSKDGLLDESELFLYNSSRSRLANEVYRETDVIFCTPQVAGDKQFRKRYCKATLLINDECGQMDEAHHSITMSLPTLQRIINVGDVKQLPPMACEEVRQWTCSLAKRQIANGAAENRLNRQYRMAPSIATFSNRMFYSGTIEDDDSVVNSPANSWFRELNKRLFDVDKNDLWLDSGECNEVQVGSSFNNPAEARLVKRAVEALVASGVAIHNIGIISAYSSQQDILQEELRSIPGAAAQVHTVDAYQGSERDVIIYSLVRSNNLGSKGFLRSEARSNVALTRAKHSRIIFGDHKMFLKQPADMGLHVQHLQELARYHLGRVGRIVAA